MNYYNFSFKSKNYLILCNEKRYSRTESGKNWKRNPDIEERIVYRAEQYENCVTAVQWFRDMFGSTHERVEWGYTGAGYIPVQITSISPDCTEKVVRFFEFVYLPDMERAAGWRENEIIKKAHKYTAELYKGRAGEMWKRLTLYTNDDGVTAAGTFDFGRMVWVN